MRWSEKPYKPPQNPHSFSRGLVEKTDVLLPRLHRMDDQLVAAVEDQTCSSSNRPRPSKPNRNSFAGVSSSGDDANSQYSAARRMSSSVSLSRRWCFRALA